MTNKMKLMSLFVAFSMIGCSLEVDNPNSLLEADLADPSAASALANGAWNAVLNGVGNIMIANAVITDEVVWTGSRDAWRQLDKGGVSNVYNEFVDGAWPSISEGRWMADKAVSVLTKGVEFLFKKNKVSYYKGIASFKSAKKILVKDEKKKGNYN